MGAVPDTRTGDTDVDLHSFDAFFRREYPVMVALGVALTGDRELARDVAQESMLRAFDRWPQVGQLERPGAWCRQVALNLVRDRWRRQKTEAAAIVRLQGEPLLVAQAPAGPAHEFWAAVRALPARQREVIALYYLADRSVADIADTLGVAAGTVKGVLFDARKALAASLGVRDDWGEF